MRDNAFTDDSNEVLAPTTADPNHKNTLRYHIQDCYNVAEADIPGRFANKVKNVRSFQAFIFYFIILFLLVSNPSMW